MLNSKTRDRIFIAGTAAIILAAVLAYVLFPHVQTDVSRTIGKLNMDDPKGLLMFLHGHSETSALWAAVILAEQTLAPFLSKSAAVSSAVTYFGAAQGIILCTAGITAGLLATFCISRSAGLLVNRKSRNSSLKENADRFGPAAVFVISLLPLLPSALTGYAAGLTGMKLSRYLPAAAIGQALCLILFFTN
jgi:uncharacterized membrane protein YdjX (TVP38/TMEM64 family)